MLNFEEFLFESQKESSLLSKMDPFVLEFFRAIDDYSDTNHRIELSSNLTGAPSFEVKTAERGSYWWCASSEEYFNCYRPDNSRTSLVVEAEREESVERKLPLSEKNITPFYLMELKVNLHSHHIYRVVGLNMQNKTFSTQDIGDVTNKIEEIFDNLMKKYYPIVRSSKKYGLS